MNYVMTAYRIVYVANQFGLKRVDMCIRHEELFGLLCFGRKKMFAESIAGMVGAATAGVGR